MQIRTGQELKHVRSVLKLTPAEMAGVLGCSLRTYYRYEESDKVDLTAARLVVSLLKNPTYLWELVGIVREGLS